MKVRRDLEYIFQVGMIDVFEDDDVDSFVNTGSSDQCLKVFGNVNEVFSMQTNTKLGIVLKIKDLSMQKIKILNV